MTRIGLISDTHSFVDPTLKTHFKDCDEIWHAGDFGSAAVIDELASWGKTLRLVYGNIDDHEVRSMTVKDLTFQCEGLTVLMTHIAGYPGRYNKRARALLDMERPDIMVCGHSHILKVIYDKQLDHLHLNPGACGKYGAQTVRTALRFSLDNGNIQDMQVIELEQLRAIAR